MEFIRIFLPVVCFVAMTTAQFGSEGAGQPENAAQTGVGEEGGSSVGSHVGHQHYYDPLFNLIVDQQSKNQLLQYLLVRSMMGGGGESEGMMGGGLLQTMFIMNHFFKK